MKGIFRGKSIICKDDNAETFILCRSKEIYKDDSQKKTNEFPKSFLTRDRMLFKDDNHYLKNQCTCVHWNPAEKIHIPSIENWFGDEYFNNIMRTLLRYGGPFFVGWINTHTEIV